MQVDETPFPVNTMELQQPKVLVRPHQAKSTKGKNVVLGEERPIGHYSWTAGARGWFATGGQTGYARRSDRLSPWTLEDADSEAPPVTGGQTARQDQPLRVPPRQDYRPKWKEEVQSMNKRKLQRLRFRERQEQELEKQRDEFFNQLKTMIPQKKEWKPKEDPQAVKPASDRLYRRSDRVTQKHPSTSVPTAEDDEELVDYSSSPERMNLDVNVLHMSMDGDMLSEEKNNPRFAASDGVPPEVVIVGFHGASATGGLIGPYRRSSGEKISTTARSSAFRLTELLGSTITAMHGMGARKFGIINMGLIGCTPSVQSSSGHGGDGPCDHNMNKLAYEFNSALRTLMSDLATKLHRFRYSLAEFYAFSNATFSNPLARDTNRSGFRTTRPEPRNRSTTAKLP
ncbi:hypothetical protein HU200_004133 [Digitaria exilis]|uniref:Uncharacterized protein n=1 Tax=Digitaria exilis TaxID=1010633 RepID=A0A835FVK3_9POAL|nr:hypothetical protein HU200_004133 [Digitaria exilis]